MPFWWKNTKERALKDFAGRFALQCKPFQVQLNGFDAFPKRVIFVKVEDNLHLHQIHKKLAADIRKHLQITNQERSHQHFHAHMTVAFRDLRPSRFSPAWQEFSSKAFSASFTANDLCLLQHSGKEWSIHARYKFNHLPAF